MIIYFLKYKLRSGAIYILKFKKLKPFLGDKPIAYIVLSNRSINIDTKIDLLIAKYFFKIFK